MDSYQPEKPSKAKRISRRRLLPYEMIFVLAILLFSMQAILTLLDCESWVKLANILAGSAALLVLIWIALRR